MNKIPTRISRRDFMKIGTTYGTTSTLIAAGALGAGATATTLAQAARNNRKSAMPRNLKLN